MLITPLSENDLAEDILIRLVKQRLFSIDSWQIIKSIFRATNIDPRLIQHPWIPQALLDWMPANRYSPVMGGFLDAEVVWPLLLEHGLKLTAERPDVAAILEWSAHQDHVALYRQSTEEFCLAARNWLVTQAGTAAETILNCVANNPLPDALPLGLAAHVIFHPDAQNKLEKAIGKFEERFLSGQSPQLSTMNAWSIAANQALAAFSNATQQALIQRSDAILAEVSAEGFAYLSTVSELGFNQHLSDLSKQLIALLKGPAQSKLDKLTQTYQIVKSHQQAIQFLSERRLERLDMALRLAQWLVTYKIAPAAKPIALEEAIAYHTQEGSFLDWARRLLPMAEPNRELATAYSKLFETITAIREAHSQQFAHLLKDWTAVGSTRKSVLPVEQILATVVAPLAETHPVLLIVLDGLSVSITHELLGDLIQQNWHLISPESQDYSIQAGLAAIPSVTDVSRMSLLCGQLCQGASNKEVQGFCNHPDLVRHSKRNMPPLLFHKKTFRQATHLPSLTNFIALSNPTKIRLLG
ncbi:MAG: BREX-2 system phosphatase PglZ [Phormidesmis sp. RL_2_1]|nr:BREX-2 system phosphatase PglZ [Phormidesmis sp. RL_2_1]